MTFWKVVGIVFIVLISLCIIKWIGALILCDLVLLLS